jgi:glucose/mannose-6-phosphate isomerase
VIDLDNLEVYDRFDPAGMRAQLHGLPDQCYRAWQQALQYNLPDDFKDIDKLVILGMGGSAIAGDLMAGLAARSSRLHIFVNRGYSLPAYVDIKTLVIASSYSGNTEETLSAFGQALDSPCKKLAITAGGELQAIAEGAHIPVFTIEHVSPPRAALGYSLIPLIVILQKLGVSIQNQSGFESMIKHLESVNIKTSETAATGSNTAKRLAMALYGKTIAVYGAELTSAVANRWKSQFNENSKAWAYYDTLPELNHNSVMGYQFPVEQAGNMYVVLLRCSSVHPRVLQRYRITSELLTRHGIGHQIIDGHGEDDLTQIIDLVLLGDWASYYLAILNETDPTPVQTIEYVKNSLNDAK